MLDCWTGGMVEWWNGYGSLSILFSFFFFFFFVLCYSPCWLGFTGLIYIRVHIHSILFLPSRRIYSKCAASYPSHNNFLFLFSLFIALRPPQFLVQHIENGTGLLLLWLLIHKYEQTLSAANCFAGFRFRINVGQCHYSGHGLNFTSVFRSPFPRQYIVNKLVLCVLVVAVVVCCFFFLSF